MEQFILKERLKEQIGNRKVMAALFYTFNFDPRFFENYVLPLFIPGKTFRDEIIHNKILWRTCIKEKLVPPVTVFCDYFAKDKTEAPSLDYDIICIKTPAAKGAICNFHPKQIFILLKDEKNAESLLFITGSGNLTPGGWCENIEGFSFQEIRKNKSFPNKTTTNILQEMISQTVKLASPSRKSTAVDLVDNFLRYVDYNKPYFCNLHQSFSGFIEENILGKENITEVEIISPYFSDDTGLVEYLKTKGIKNIKCLVPTLRNNEIQLGRETFNRYTESGMKWCFWAKHMHLGKENNRNNEVRNLHAKIYRFLGKHKMFTVIGSVNFTHPAWKKVQQKDNKANVESAFLYTETFVKPLLTIPSNVTFENFHFIEKESLEDGSLSNFETRNPPDIDFILDWKTRALTANVKNTTEGCYFKNIFLGDQVKIGTSKMELSPGDIKQLTKNSLIEVAQTVNDNIAIHAYYPQQLNIEVKPLDFKIDATTILKYWEFLNDEFYKEALTRRLAESSTDESGVVDESTILKKSLLNEMAAHFSGLVKLERYLFPALIQKKSDRKEAFRLIKYYLLTENIDTLPFYFEDLKNKLLGGEILASFYWMIVQIVAVNFYAKAEKWQYRSDLEQGEWRAFKKDIQERCNMLKQNAKPIGESIRMNEIQQQWVINQLSENHEQ